MNDNGNEPAYPASGYGPSTKGFTKREELAARMMSSLMPRLLELLEKEAIKTSELTAMVLDHGARIANNAADALLKSWEV